MFKGADGCFVCTFLICKIKKIKKFLMENTVNYRQTKFLMQLKLLIIKGYKRYITYRIYVKSKTMKFSIEIYEVKCFRRNNIINKKFLERRFKRGFKIFRRICRVR